ncbi:MAG: ATP-binding protein [Thioalkalivibrio sp.]|nr:ATP-binding protein [Thioalkalivibrio sp.]
MTTTNPHIKSTSDLGIDYAKVVAYGPPGSGKTTFAATFPDVLLLSAESGLLSVRDRDLAVWTIDTWEDLQEAFAYLKAGDHTYKSVAIDSLTEVQRKLAEHIVRKFPAKRRDYEDLMSQSDWGYAIDSLRKMCRAFRDLPMNVLYIALDAVKEVEGENITRPALSGGTMADELMGWVDAVIYCPGPQRDEDGELDYLGQTVAAKGRRAKMRVPVGVKVPAVIPLDYSVLHSFMFPELKKPSSDGKKGS